MFFLLSFPLSPVSFSLFFRINNIILRIFFYSGFPLSLASFLSFLHKWNYYGYLFSFKFSAVSCFSHLQGRASPRLEILRIELSDNKVIANSHSGLLGKHVDIFCPTSNTKPIPNRHLIPPFLVRRHNIFIFRTARCESPVIRNFTRSMFSVICLFLSIGMGELCGPSCSHVNTIMTRSDKRITLCQFGHPELLMPSESAIKELWFEIRFKTVPNAKVKLWPLNVRW